MHLNSGGDQLEPAVAPGLVDAVWRAVGRDERAEEDVAVEDDPYQARRARSSASSTAWLISGAERWAF